MKAARIGALAALALFAAANDAPPRFDIVIRGATVIDGTGGPARSIDVAIAQGRIAAIGRNLARGRREIAAQGRHLTPGFIDMMDQSGRILLTHGGAENKLRQGVTTLIAGEGGTPVDAAQIPDYFARLERQGIAVNFGTYYATTQARAKIMGEASGAPNADQLAAMAREVDQAMRAGAFGITSALIYPPSSFQSTDDLVALARAASPCGSIYATHMRDESAQLLQSIEEVITIAERGGVAAEIFHLKAAYAPQWGQAMPRAVAMIEAARQRGVDIAADIYPYVAGGTGLSITVPNWVWEQGVAAGVARLRDPAVRATLKRQLAAGSMPGWSNLVEASGGWDRVVLANAHNPKHAALHGRSIAAIAADQQRDPADVAWDLVLDGLPNRVMALFFMMSEDDLVTALRAPWTSIGSDAAASAAPGAVDALGLPHPRAYGTFPRVIAEYVQRRRVLTLEEAVHKMTGWPARRMGLADRGTIAVGKRADLTLLDLAKLDDVASWTQPTASPRGVELVVVNGAVALDQGAVTGSRSGAVLRHRCAPRSGPMPAPSIPWRQ